MIAQNIQEATHTCFSVAQKRVYSLMENNSYPRFLESEFYQELCKKTPISRAAQGTWAMDRREKQPLGWRGSQATAQEQHSDPEVWGTEHCLLATVQGQILTLVQSWWLRAMLLKCIQGKWQKCASQLLAVPFPASAAVRGGRAGALLSRPRSAAAGPDRASFLWTEAALCTWTLLGTWVIGCLFIFPKDQPALLLSVAWCAHTSFVTASSCQELCWVSVQPSHSNSTVSRWRDVITQFPEEQVLQVKYAGLGCVSWAVWGQTEGRTWPRQTGAV